MPFLLFINTTFSRYVLDQSRISLTNIFLASSSISKMPRAHPLKFILLYIYTLKIIHILILLYIYTLKKYFILFNKILFYTTQFSTPTILYIQNSIPIAIYLIQPSSTTTPLSFHSSARGRGRCQAMDSVYCCTNTTSIVPTLLQQNSVSDRACDYNKFLAQGNTISGSVAHPVPQCRQPKPPAPHHFLNRIAARPLQHI